MTAPLLAEFTSGFASSDPHLRMVLIQWPISLAPALFTWLLPTLLGFRRGGMAWLGLAIAAVLTLLLPLQRVWPPWSEWYWHVHCWLYVAFYIYSAAGIALCAVGIFDGKRSAIWALLAVLALTAAAVADTVIWFGLVSGPPLVPCGFLAFWVLLAIGFLRKAADPPAPLDRLASAKQLANNLTRRSLSIPRKLLREGNIHLLPVYYLLNMSDLGREGIERSGSYRFADHIYRNVPSGRNAIGKWLDSLMLRSPATQAFRDRYFKARDALKSAVESHAEQPGTLRLLAIPCGLPRDLNELAEILAKENLALLSRLEYRGMDIDPELLAKARDFTKDCPIAHDFHQGNALLRENFPAGPFVCVVSTGLNEFLDPLQIGEFFRNVHGVLAPGGTFFTSCTQQEQSSEFLMRAFELNTRYHRPDELERTFAQLPWSRVRIWQHETGMQTFVVAVK
jgi:hypothetical protein